MTAELALALQEVRAFIAGTRANVKPENQMEFLEELHRDVGSQIDTLEDELAVPELDAVDPTPKVHKALVLALLMVAALPALGQARPFPAQQVQSCEAHYRATATRLFAATEQIHSNDPLFVTYANLGEITNHAATQLRLNGQQSYLVLCNLKALAELDAINADLKARGLPASPEEREAADLATTAQAIADQTAKLLHHAKQ